MATLDPNTLIGILRGHLGDLVFVPARDGTVIVKHRPVRTAEFTDGERRGQNGFSKAAAYVKRVRQQPEIYALYQAAARAARKRACDLAHKDFRLPPVIEDVDLSTYRGSRGDSIRIRAVDDFAVASASVSLARLDGVILEHGAARTDGNGLTWLYVTQTEISLGQTILVHVTVSDWPGNQVTKTCHHALITPT